MGSGSARTARGVKAPVAVLLAGLWAAGGAGAAPVCEAGRVLLGQPDALRASFAVELADTAGERAQGLMFREQLPASAGMLFVYPAPQQAVFWMKNTLIPLDMIFADATGRVTRVHSGAVPQDETPIDGGSNVQFVLEINAGLAAAMGIAPGVALAHPAIDQSRAAWPCARP